MNKNIYKCAPAIWRKFSNYEKGVYNSAYKQLKEMNIFHPKTKLTKPEKETIYHNAACIAVWSV